MRKGSGGDRVRVTGSWEARSRVVRAVTMRAQEGVPTSVLEGQALAYEVGSIMLTRCAGCRSGNCKKHVPIIPSLVADLEMVRFQNSSSDSTTTDKPIETANGASSVPTQAEALKFVLAPLEPPKKPERTPRVPSVKRTYPEGFVLTDDMRAYAEKYGIEPGCANKEFEKFSIHHRARGSKFVDWTLAWYTWCRNYSDYGPRTGAPTNKAPSPAQGSGEKPPW